VAFFESKYYKLITELKYKYVHTFTSPLKSIIQYLLHPMTCNLFFINEQLVFIHTSGNFIFNSFHLGTIL